MVKIKNFKQSLFSPNPQKALEEFIQENNIKDEDIISVTPTSINLNKGRTMSTGVSLTYKT